MRELHTIGIRVTASGTLERNQVWAESVFIRGCQDMRYLKGPQSSTQSYQLTTDSINPNPSWALAHRRR